MKCGIVNLYVFRYAKRYLYIKMGGGRTSGYI